MIIFSLRFVTGPYENVLIFNFFQYKIKLVRLLVLMLIKIQWTVFKRRVCSVRFFSVFVGNLSLKQI